MTRPIRLSLAILMLGALGACASMSLEEQTALCRDTDWKRYGVNDGALGLTLNDRAEIFEDCAELGLPADTVAYQAGRSEGLGTYCTAENGYEVGFDGRRYKKVCPPTTEPDFLQGYNRGRRDRPAYAVYPQIGIGIGTGGVRTRVGVGVGVGLFNFGRCRHGHICW